MPETTRLLDAARAKLDCTDADLARKLRRSRSRIAEWRSGAATMPEDIAYQLAQMAGEDPPTALLTLHAERATGPSNKAWRELLDRLKKAGVMLALTAGLAGPQDSQANDPSMYIMSSRRRRPKYQTPSVLAHLKSQLLNVSHVPGALRSALGRLANP